MFVPQNLLGGRPASKHRHIDRLCGNKHATPIAVFLASHSSVTKLDPLQFSSRHKSHAHNPCSRRTNHHHHIKNNNKSK